MKRTQREKKEKIQHRFSKEDFKDSQRRKLSEENKEKIQHRFQERILKIAGEKKIK